MAETIRPSGRHIEGLIVKRGRVPLVAPIESNEGPKDKIGRLLHRIHPPWRRDMEEPVIGGNYPPVHELTQGEAGNLRSKENETPEKIRPIRPEDVQTMINEGWFEDWERIKGLKGDVINKNTVPEVWNDETRRKFKEDVLMPFYFPGGTVHIKAEDEKGNLIREVDVERQTFVLEWRGKLVACRSFIDKDPWARDSEFSKFKMAHAQMLIVAPNEEGKGFGGALALNTHKEIFEKQGFTHIITWINMDGTNYGVQEQFFLGQGYEEDRTQKGLIVINPTVPDERIRMRRYLLTPKKRDAIFASDNDPRLKWEKRKYSLLMKEARHNSSR